MPLGTPRAQLCAQEPPRPSWHHSSLRRPAFPGHLCDLDVIIALWRPRRPPPSSHFPQSLGVPLPRRCFPSISSAFCASARGCPSKMKWEGGATTQLVPHSSCGQKPLSSSCQQPRSGPNDTGRRKTGQEEDTGSGTTLPALDPHYPPRFPQQLLDSRDKATIPHKQTKKVPPPPQV